MRISKTLAVGLGLLALLATGCSPLKLDDTLYDPLKAPAGGYQLSTAVIPAATEVLISTTDGKTLQGYFIPSSGARPDVTLIYFHGRSNNVGTSWQRLEYLYPLGCNILAVDVRGYGLSTGSPDEAGIDIDVRAIWDFATGANMATPPTKVSDDHVIVYGRSLGAAFAVQLAYAESGSGDLVPPAALITESAFTSVAALVQDGVYVDLPPGFVARSSWDSLAKIGNVHSAFLALHGTADSYVQPRYSEELFAAHVAALPALYSSYIPVIGADHDDVPEVLSLATYQADLATLLALIPDTSLPAATPGQ